MSFLRPKHPFRRLLYSVLLMGVWLCIISQLWVRRAYAFNPHTAADAPNPTCGILAPFCGSWQYGRFYHIHPVRFGITLVATTLLTFGLLRVHEYMVNEPPRRCKSQFTRGRRRHGLCERCGYDVRGVKRCPECDHPVYPDAT